MSGPRLAKVKSARELKPGTWIYAWSADGGCYWLLLLKKHAQGRSVSLGGLEDPVPRPGWTVVGEPEHGRVCHASLLKGIRKGKIWRVVGGGNHRRQVAALRKVQP